MSKPLIELATDIVAAQAACRSMSPDDMVQTLHAIYHALSDLQQIHQPANQDNPDLSYLRRHPLESFQRDQVICLETGKPFKLLSNKHLALYGLTPRQYKKKWGIPQTTPLSSRSLTQRRKKIAKDLGMGSQLAEWRAQRKSQGTHQPDDQQQAV